MDYPTQAAIVAGGKGTRLGALTANTPKPLLSVGDHVFIEYLLYDLSRQGITDVVVLVGPFEEQFRRALGNGDRWGITLDYVPEPEPAGTAGALAHAFDVLDPAFFVLNGDTFLNCNLLDLGRSFVDRCSDLDGAVALVYQEDAARYGLVEQTDGSITAFREKQTGTSGWINAGAYVFARAALEKMIDHVPMSLETSVLPRMVDAGRLGGMVYDRCDFLDIGIPTAFESAQIDVPDWARRPVAFVRMSDAPAPGVLSAEAIRALNDRGAMIFLLTPPQGEGPMARDAYRAGLNDTLRPVGAFIDCVLFDPTVSELEAVLAHWAVDRNGSRVLGGKEEDRELARALGIPITEAHSDLIKPD